MLRVAPCRSDAVAVEDDGTDVNARHHSARDESSHVVVAAVEQHDGTVAEDYYAAEDYDAAAAERADADAVVAATWFLEVEEVEDTGSVVTQNETDGSYDDSVVDVAVVDDEDGEAEYVDVAVVAVVLASCDVVVVVVKVRMEGPGEAALSWWVHGTEP
jgi:hypothetical protein